MSDKKRRWIRGLTSPKDRWTFCGPVGHHSPLSFLTPAWSRRVPAWDQEISILWLHISSTLMVSMSPFQDLSPLMVISRPLDSAVTPPVSVQGSSPQASGHSSALYSFITPSLVIFFHGSHFNSCPKLLGTTEKSLRGACLDVL